MHFTRISTLGKIVLCSLLPVYAGCVVNFKSEKAPSKGIIDVKVKCVYPGKSEPNTFENYYKKEIEAGRYAQTEIKLDPGQQLLILNRALTYKFFQMPESFNHKAPAASSEPHSLRIRADTMDRTVTWTGPLDDLHPNTFHLKELVLYIDSITRSTDEYSGLPKSALTGN